MSNNRRRPQKSVYRRGSIIDRHDSVCRVGKNKSKGKNKKTARSSTKASRIQVVIECWQSFESFHPTVRRVAAQLGEGWTEKGVRQILETYGPNNGIFLNQFERDN